MKKFKCRVCSKLITFPAEGAVVCNCGTKYTPALSEYMNIVQANPDWDSNIKKAMEWYLTVIEPDLEMLKPTGYEHAVIGIAYGRAGPPVYVIDEDILTHTLIEESDSHDELEAIEYMDFNIKGSYIGKGTPLYFRPLTSYLDIGSMEEEHPEIATITENSKGWPARLMGFCDGMADIVMKTGKTTIPLLMPEAVAPQDSYSVPAAATEFPEDAAIFVPLIGFNPEMGSHPILQLRINMARRMTGRLGLRFEY